VPVHAAQAKGGITHVEREHHQGPDATSSGRPPGVERDGGHAAARAGDRRTSGVLAAPDRLHRRADPVRPGQVLHWSVDWPDYLAGWINSIAPGSGQDFMYFVGGVEILAGLLVLLAPRIGAFVVAAWLGGIVVNLLTYDPPQYYDIALRDLGLMLGALTLGRLALAVVPARKSGMLPSRPW
jgi:hypothetical protein